MLDNLFAPPKSTVVDGLVGRVRKPLAVWLVQLLMLAILVPVIRGFVVVIALLGEDAERAPLLAAAIAAVDVFVLFVVLAALFGSEFRKPFARLLGPLLVIGASTLWAYFWLIIDPPVRAIVASPTRQRDESIGLAFTVALLLVGALLCLAYVFGARVRAWFRPSNEH